MLTGKPNGGSDHRALAGRRLFAGTAGRAGRFSLPAARVVHAAFTPGVWASLRSAGSRDMPDVIRGGAMKRAAVEFTFTLGAGRGEVLGHAAAVGRRSPLRLDRWSSG